ncbi:FIST C-terminal domain-containing protein [Gilvibacter sp.]|uniref:FIST signal transduction protein n=1 Tax=Gilvibacter sp. TaxID=2729997 RepID=UPI0025BE882D|nr:FIST C-terminal domain-containing protein [Gilvibacter sp.]NQX77999.1 FIST C-terminal domain-containing protein [Gilvibacter sp.]
MIFKEPTSAAILTAIEAKVSTDTLFVIKVAENTQLDIPGLIQDLNGTSAQYIGGIFPKLIYDGELLDEGVIVTVLTGLQQIHVVEGLASGSYELEKHPVALDSDFCVFTFVDGLASGISGFLSELYRSYGSEIRYFGGGAGSLSLQQAPCLFSRDGFLQDAAVYCLLKKTTYLGVKHGWEKLGGPFIATKTNANVVEEINWQPAFETYREIVEADCEYSFDDKPFFDISKGYPFGMVREGSECVVRDPIAVNDQGHLICVGEVPENTFLDILKGKNDQLIEAAKQAAKEAADQVNSPAAAIIIDCISRVLFLDDHFEKEVSAVNMALEEKGIKPTLRGALTLGEISSFGEGFIEFFNKTTVVGLFE